MKAFLLTTALAVSCTCSSFAQKTLWENFLPDIKWDLGVNYGGSTISIPNGPANNYTGSRTTVVPDYSVCVQYAFAPNWHVMLDIGARKWQTTGTWQEPYTFGSSLKAQDVSFLYAKSAITESIKFNYAIPFYSGYNSFNRANLTFGVELGLVTSVNDGSVGYSKYNAQPDSSYKYLSSYHYGFGIGYSVGAQVAYTYYFLPRWGVTAEVAARYVDVGANVTNGVNYMHNENRYHMFFFPETFGVRYRIK